ncbi:hypothetical protein EV182_007005, partial [Spiromyces aspiralis]
SFNEIATDKRDHLDTHEAFENNILASFNFALKDHGLLTDLASELQATLIDWE